MMLPSSSKPPQPSTSASPPSLLWFFSINPPDLSSTVPPFPIYSPTTQEGLRSPMTMAATSLPSSSTVSLCFLTTSTATCLFFSDIHRRHDLSPFRHLLSTSIVVRSFAVDLLLGFVDLTRSAPPHLGLLFRLLFRRSHLPLHFSSPRRRPPSFSVVGSRCHHLAAAVGLLHRLPPLLSHLRRRSHPSPASSSSSSSLLSPLPSSR